MNVCKQRLKAQQQQYLSRGLATESHQNVGTRVSNVANRCVDPRDVIWIVGAGFGEQRGFAVL